MKQLKYGIFSEDFANHLFMEAFTSEILATFSVENVELKYEEDFNTLSVGNDTYKVRKGFSDAVKTGIARYDLDLVFVALDLDPNFAKLPTEIDSKLLEEERKKLHETMMKTADDKDIKGRILISIAVQSIEYWFHLLKMKVENLPVSPDFELKNRKEMKSIVYSGRVRRKKIKGFIESLLENFDVDFLKGHSTSFARFYEEVEEYFGKIL